MIRTISYVQRDIGVLVQAPLVVANATLTDTKIDTICAGKEMAVIELYNAGPDVLYYSYGADASLTNFCGIIQVNQMLNVEAIVKLTVFSKGGGGATLSYTLLHRVGALTNYQ